MKPITEKRFDYMLNVLPPLVLGKEMVICFLKDFDLNPIYKELGDFNDLFIQGEGYDIHTIFGVRKKSYFEIGTTLKMWETETFRYPDSYRDMNQEISKKLGVKI